MQTSIFRIWACDSVRWNIFALDLFHNEFIDYMLARKTLIDYTDLLSPHNLKKNDKIILSYIKVSEVPSMYPN